ncbi:flagellar hook capping FlgD N-terminal domain-containing protein [Clostridium uliginosum]|uniref:Basal-body rod modification protein FlgD n=1 Tax=Clostridium uliginosum TaxID=119641 RepID=A0A1I1KSY3_9CLOT|nr:flagellar hook capping FlgD N-terminal domain-containing protein [Clostridium uliginosum]SFC61263.1 flagellar basal-body rod modification protein FlgD [Clostridium uliginosum]
MAVIDANTAVGKNDASGIIARSNKSTTQATTDKGTPIINGKNSGFDKNSFLKILSAQLSNLDPSANQDSTAYVTQMAQFAAMEQMYNLNDTMSTFAYQQLIGKGVTMDVPDNDGKAYTGIVRGVSKEASGTYLSVEVNENGKNVYKKFDIKKLQSVLGIPDYTSSNMLVNSDFSAASALANDKDNKVVIADTDKDGKTIIIKGTIKSAFIDNGVVKVRVETIGADGNPGEIKVYPYGSIMKAGNLTDEDMNVKVDDTTKTDSSTNTQSTGTTSQTGSTSSKDSLANIDENLKTLTSILGK